MYPTNVRCVRKVADPFCSSSDVNSRQIGCGTAMFVLEYQGGIE